MTAKKPRLPGIACPHCSDRMIVRSSEQMVPTMRELRLACQNIDCGHTCLGQISIIKTVRPSLRPNPSIHLPIGDWKPPANDTAPKPANDDKPPAANEPSTQAAPMSG